MRPKLILTIACLTLAQIAFAQPKTETITYQSNTITMEYLYDTMMVVDPETGEERMVVSKKEKLDLLNGAPIFYDEQAAQPVGAASQKNVQSFVRDLSGVKELLEGELNLNRVAIVIDEKGNVSYIHVFPNSRADETVEKRTKLAALLKDVRFFPAQKEGKAVPYGVHIN